MKEIKEFVEVISKSIERERPLFIKNIFDSIKESISKGIYELKEIVETIMKNVYENFTNRKKSIKSYKLLG